MPSLCKYLRATGAIVGVWESNTMALVDAQTVVDDPTYGYIATSEPLSATDLQLSYYIVGNETVTAKTELTLSATPSPFAADGVEVCVISVTPFVPCTLVINGTPAVLTEGDETVSLTAEVPETFVVTLEPMATHWANPLTVEAI